MIAFLISALKIIFVLGFLVLIHEGGHFLVAKFFKVNVNEFSIGFGKEIISRKKKETKYTLRMIPFGGYVSMLGEEERVDDEGSFSNLSVPKRIAIVAAGGIVNIIFGLGVYFLLVSIIGNFYSMKINYLNTDYGAYIAGIREGDEILSINNKNIHLISDIEEILAESNGDEVNVEVDRNGEILNFNVKPTEEKTKTIGIYLGTTEDATTEIEYIYDDSPAGVAGVEIGDVIKKIDNQEINNYQDIINLIENSNDEIELVVDRNGELKTFMIHPAEVSTYYLGTSFEKADLSLGNRLYYGFWETTDFSFALVDNVKQLFTGNVSADQLMGPVGISKTVAQTSTLEDFVYLMALISLSLGITNLLPFPALDGGKIVLLIIEAIRRKPLKENTEITIQLIGFSLLILLSIYVSYNDILRIF